MPVVQRFSNDELILVLGYREKDKWSTLVALEETLGDLSEDSVELRQIFQGAMKKLSLLTEDEFKALDIKGNAPFM